MVKKNYNIIIQARLDSTRLPNKVLIDLCGLPIIQWVYNGVKKSKFVDKIIFAIPNTKKNDLLNSYLRKFNFNIFRGSTDDVLDRFYKAANQYLPDYIVRVTSDCPLIDPELIDEVINKTIFKKVDYCSNIITEDFPDGQDIEVFKFKALQKAWTCADLKSDREHVTSFIRNNSESKGNRMFTTFDVKSLKNYNHVRMTVDELDDLETVRWLVSELGSQKNWLEYTNHMLNNQSFLKNSNIIRNEGYIKSLKLDKNE